MAKDIRRITIFAGKHDPGVYNWSPFVNKLQARLRFANVSYDMTGCSLSKAPKGKIPYIGLNNGDTTSFPPESSTNSNPIGDTALITKHLIGTSELPEINQDLTQVEAAQDLALRALLEDKIYFMMIRERWLVNANFYKMRDEGPLSTIPYPIRVLVGLIVSRKNFQTSNGQGMGRYSDDEVAALRDEAWGAINCLVASSAARPRTSPRQRQDRAKINDASRDVFWALGKEGPTELDATLYGFLSAILTCPANPDSEATIRRHPALIEYAKRIHDAYFPDCQKWEE